MYELLCARRPEDPHVLSTARFIGHGLIGAIEVWLLGDKSDPEEFVAAVLDALPAWISAS